MFQDFSSPPSSKGSAIRIASLREIMHKREITGFLVPRSDEHQGEYVPAYAERLSYLTGFTGSAGCAVIMDKEAAIFVDGRYTLQVQNQIDEKLIQAFNSGETSHFDWLQHNLQKDERLAYDPWLHTISEVEKLEKIAIKKEAQLVSVDNLIDEIWQNQPLPPQASIQIHPLEYSGQPALEKINAVQNSLGEEGVDGFFFTQPDTICWLLNIRGRDVPHTPLVLGFLYVPHCGKPVFFIDPAKLTRQTRQYLEALCELETIKKLLPFLKKITTKTGLAPHTTSIIIKQSLEKAGTTKNMADPCVLPKACKNEKELDGTRKAHLRDGVAMANFLYWLSKQKAETLDEIGVAKKLEETRREVGHAHKMPLQDISFDTISGFGPNGAIVHYRVTEETNKKFEEGNLFLIDSGAQYQDGTTDITRTLAIGTPTDEMKKHFTLVLKGMIAVSTLKFPEKTNGAQIDILARHALWQNGLDYDHGTGHGVGSFLSVHEGPQRISKIPSTPLQEGMILSNEPGFYRQDHYGIRIENLIAVKASENIKGGERPMMSFETLTFTPIDKKLIDVSILSQEERNWLNEYHRQVFKRLAPNLDENIKNWLRQETEPL